MRNRIVVSIFLCSAVYLAWTCFLAPLASSSGVNDKNLTSQWRECGGTSANTNCYAGPLAESFDVAWHVRAGCSAEGASGVIVGDTMVFGVSPSPEIGEVYALDKMTGKAIWNYKVGEKHNGISSVPAFYEDRLYVQIDDQLMAFDADPRNDSTDEGIADTPGANGSEYDLIWSAKTAGRCNASSPKVTAKYVYFHDNNGLQVYDRNGNADGSAKLITTLLTGGSIDSTPAITSTMVYVGSAKGVFAFSTKDWSQVWMHVTPEPVTSAPVVDDNGRVYVCCDNNMTYCMNGKDGAVIWEARTKCGPVHSPTVSNDLVFVITSSNDGVYALETDSGKQAWYFSIPDFVESKSSKENRTYSANSAILATNQKLVFNTLSGFCYVINTDRMLDKEKSRVLYKYAGPRESSPAVADGSIFVRCRPEKGGDAEIIRLDPK